MPPSSSEHLTIPLSTGVELEARLHKPENARTSASTNKIAICLHPWSWLGGRMTDPVLGIVKDALLLKGYHVLRYNSRGVGRSTGRASFTGLAEGEDLEALVRWALGQIPNVTNVAIVGYSHGSLIASLHPVLEPPVQTQHILISYPLGPRGWLTLFKSSHYTAKLSDLLRDPRGRVLIVHGDNDEFTSAGSYRTWVEELQKVTQGEAKAQLAISLFPGVSHFWHGLGQKDLEDAIASFAV
ncbi:Alpha/Beta hydrolase protein [Schizophyllum amplum]|uniref:Alpha/Beta hydrolase protein n=1 Tax=Schizophyllum amplum TaxID=97359 RepID=A0A550CJW4_9AGAR|nr:Alpha/Beta hydrolase protein [Auriculariopsis ampla]